LQDFRVLESDFSSLVHVIRGCKAVKKIDDMQRALSPEEIEDFIMWELEAMGIRTYRR
jgi:hypothetical protein